MKKIIAFIIISLFLFTFISAGLTTKAIDDNGNDDVGQIREGSNDNSEDDSNENQIRIQERERILENIQNEFRREISVNGDKIKIEKKIETENGKIKIKIKKTITYSNGSKEEIEYEFQRNNEGEIQGEIKIKGESISINNGVQINDLFENDDPELGIVSSNANKTDIKILPERAREIARERLRIRNISQIRLEEVKHKNIPRVVYNIESNQEGRFLGIFKLRLRENIQVDPETGEVIEVNKPWWAFLVSTPDETEPETNSSE